MKSIAILLIITGSLLFIAGLLLFFLDEIPWLGKLPGDIYIQGKNYSFRFPLMTCLLLSIVISILFNLIAKYFGK